MDYLDRDFIEIERNGNVEKVELICTIDSERDNKKYVILTDDKDIDEEINIIVGAIKEEIDGSVIETVDDEEEYKYVVSLMEKIEMSEEDV